MNSSEYTNVHEQMELLIKLENPSNSETLTTHRLLTIQDEKADKQNQQLLELGQGLIEILVELDRICISTSASTEAIRKDVDIRMSASTKSIEDINTKVSLLFDGVGKTYQHINDNLGKDLSAIKAEQQALRQAIEKRTSNNTSSLDWKQIAMFATATIVITTLCSLAAFQLAANWRTDQPPTPVEKPVKTKSKKRSN